MKEKKSTQMKQKKWTTLLALCAACALIAATLSGCGSGRSATRTASVSPYSANVDSGFYPEEETIHEYDTDSISASGAESGSTLSAEEAAEEDLSQKLIRTVNMNLETMEFDSLLTDLQSRAEEMDGYVESEDVSTPSENEMRWAYLKIRIPADRLDEFLDMVGESANVTYTGESVEDVTLTYVDLETHVDELRIEQKSLESLLEEAESIEDIIAIQEQLTEIRYEIESYESQLRVLENRVDYSTVYLNISEVERETAVSGNTFMENVRTRFSNSIYTLQRGLRRFAIAFLGALPIILLVAAIVVVALLIVWGCVHHRRKLTGKLEQRKRMKQAQKDAKAQKKAEKQQKRAAKQQERAKQQEQAGQQEQTGQQAEDAVTPAQEEGEAPAPAEGEAPAPEEKEAPATEEGQTPDETAEPPEEEPAPDPEDDFDKRWYDLNGPYA